MSTGSLISLSEAYLLLPITLISAYVSNGTGTVALVQPIPGSWMATVPKWGSHNYVHSVELSLNNQNFVSPQPFHSAYVNQRLIMEMSPTDQNNVGAIYGMGDGRVDSFQSQRYNPGASVTVTGAAFPSVNCVPAVVSGPAYAGGAGMSNNMVYSGGQTPNDGDQSNDGTGVAQFTGSYNRALYTRATKFIDMTNNTNNLLGGPITATPIQSQTDANGEFVSNYTVQNTNYMVWSDYAVIPLKNLMDVVQKFPLTKCISGQLRITLNTGWSVSVYSTTGATAPSYTTSMITSASGLNFGSGSCPYIQTCGTIVPAAASGGIVTGCFVAAPPNTAINCFGLNVNFASSGYQPALTGCRLYIPYVTPKPQNLLSYLTNNRAKKICYNSFYYSQMNGIGSKATFSFLANAGLRGIKGVWVLPFVDSSVHGIANAGTGGTATTPFAQWLSPFDSAPVTTSPISLSNLQVNIGGQNVLQDPVQNGIDHFMQALEIYDTRLNAGDHRGLSNGIYESALRWNGSKVYYVDCSRDTDNQILSPRSVTITAKNNSNVTACIITFVEYKKSAQIDCETGLIMDVPV